MDEISFKTAESVEDIFSLNTRERVILNVGGMRFETFWNTINKFPETRLGRLQYLIGVDKLRSYCDAYDYEKNEFFFDRDWSMFNSILNYYRIEELHVGDEICPNMLDRELDYWDIQNPNIDKCCKYKLETKRENIEYETKKENEILHDLTKEDVFSCCPVINKKIWNLVNNPESSILARVFLILFILI